jgi:predicted metal-dependent peptidase
MSRAESKANPATLAFDAGRALVAAHPIFHRLLERVTVIRSVAGSACPAKGWLIIHRSNTLHVHPKKSASPQEWAFVLARGLLCFAMELFQPDRGNWDAWSAASDVVTVRFLLAIKFGKIPDDMQVPEEISSWDEHRWYSVFCENGIPDWVVDLSLGGGGYSSLQEPLEWTEPRRIYGVQRTWPEVFSDGLADAVSQAVEVVAGVRPSLGDKHSVLRSVTVRARSWFISSFPLLGAMVAAFDVIEDAELCRREEVMVGAVDETMRTIYLNPAAGLNEFETRFVLAHEVLHVALRHMGRRLGRDPYLWNVACDFVINDWLIDMQVGTPPALGLLHDVQLKGLSAEEVYDRIVVDVRRMRKLLTLAGRQGDMLDRRLTTRVEQFTDLDAFYKNQLSKGLLLHEAQGRGYIPAGLVEEIRALLQPPISWEVQLARWFDHHFPPIELKRTYSRLSRRQSATPDIPRPNRALDPRWLDGRTFGVVLDTSGSMDRHLLAKALGAIAGYALAKEVPAVRVIFCDATPYDMGYMPAQDIAQRIEVKGRGGTILQPGVDLLQDAEDFPKDGPILVITDGQCDKLSVKRSHAYLLPSGKRLPFAPIGEVFALN